MLVTESIGGGMPELIVISGVDFSPGSKTGPPKFTWGNQRRSVPKSTFDNPI